MPVFPVVHYSWDPPATQAPIPCEFFLVIFRHFSLKPEQNVPVPAGRRNAGSHKERVERSKVMALSEERKAVNGGNTGYAVSRLKPDFGRLRPLPLSLFHQVQKAGQLFACFQHAFVKHFFG
jgi:hypothetical protein